jgi:hypothetical protein
MSRFDRDFTREERARALAALDAAGRGGLLDGHIGRLRGQFAWGQSVDFYAGYARALLVAAAALRENPEVDHRLLAGMLLLHTGVVVQHLERQ